MTLALSSIMAATSHAALQVVGKGFDISGFSPQMKANFEIMRGKCTRCHTLERLAAAFSSGIAPISGRPFDVDMMKATTFTMVRKANAGGTTVNKDEAKSISSLLKYMIDESVR